MSERLSVPTQHLPGGGYAPAAPLKTVSEALEFARSRKVAQVDMKFVDLRGRWQHITIPASRLDADTFANGIAFKGSSVHGLEEGVLLLIPDATTAIIDPFSTSVPALSLICNIKDPISGEMCTRDSRYVAQKAEAHLRSIGIADTILFEPEVAFFVFDSVRFAQNPNNGYYFIDSDEGVWNSGRQNDSKPNLGHRLRYREGYLASPPLDSLQEMRTQIAMTLLSLGIEVEAHQHEAATAGQCAIRLGPSPLTRMADNLLTCKHVVHNLAERNSKTATFMPKPLFADNGSGLSCQQSLWNGNQPLFGDPHGYAGLSQMARWYIGGLLKHASALLALTSPSTNSYRRLAAGGEAPINLIYAQRNRSAVCHIPMHNQSPQDKRVDFRCADGLCNPYLAFSAMLMAGLDGIENQIDPGAPMDKDLAELAETDKASIRTVPGSLQEALAALEADHDFLLKGGVFTTDLLETYIRYKRSHEVDPLRLRPHPYEFYLYYEL